jgi:hypothetical protein
MKELLKDFAFGATFIGTLYGASFLLYYYNLMHLLVIAVLGSAFIAISLYAGGTIRDELKRSKQRVNSGSCEGL